MASVDAARQRVRLSDVELDVLAVLVAAPDDAALTSPEAVAALDGLAAAGVVRSGDVLPWVADLVTVVAAPALRMVVETFTVGPLQTYPVGAPPTLAVLGAPAPEGTQLSAVEPVHLPWAVARAVGLGRRPAAALDHPVTV